MGATAASGDNQAPDGVDRASGEAATAPGQAGAQGLAGLRVLVPRGGPWGEAVADDLRARGAEPLVVPLIGVAPPEDPAPLDAALDRLRAGGFDWLVVTSTTTVDALVARGAEARAGTRVAAVGSATAEACRQAGLPVELVGAGSARDLAGALPAAAGRVLLPQSDLADRGAVDALAARGADVVAVVAYRTVALPVDDATRDAARCGAIDAVLVTSGSVARQVAAQLGPLPARTLVACLGPRTTADAEAAGLHVAVTAPERSVTALLDALAAHATAGGPGTRGG